MARICPAAMIFVPSAGGVSHRPDEYTSPLQIAQGAQVLAGPFGGWPAELFTACGQRRGNFTAR
jgi:hypothetical protein